MMQTIMSKLQQGGRMQMYMLAMGGYFLFSQFTSQFKSAPSGSGSTTVVDTDDDMVGSTEVTMSRTFKSVGGEWLSYMQSDRKSDSMLLMLHRTASSADVEFSSAFAGLTSAKARIIAPDRPCHGFSPCPKAGELQNSKLLSELIRSEGDPDNVAILAVGRDAIAQALALAQKKREVKLVLMMKPKVLAPAQRADTVKDLSYSSSTQAAADAIWWAAGAEHHEQPTFNKLPKNCQVTLVYEAGDEEDEDLVTSLDSQGVEVKTLTTEDRVLAEIVNEEVRSAMKEEADDTL